MIRLIHSIFGITYKMNENYISIIIFKKKKKKKIKVSLEYKNQLNIFKIMFV